MGAERLQAAGQRERQGQADAGGASDEKGRLAGAAQRTGQLPGPPAASGIASAGGPDA
jgi:hypothetical protein